VERVDGGERGRERVREVGVFEVQIVDLTWNRAVNADQQLLLISSKVRCAVAAMTPLDYGVAEGVRVGCKGELPPAAMGPRSSYLRG
jgi:hypothetical protein